MLGQQPSSACLMIQLKYTILRKTVLLLPLRVHLISRPEALSRGLGTSAQLARVVRLAVRVRPVTATCTLKQRNSHVVDGCAHPQTANFNTYYPKRKESIVSFPPACPNEPQLTAVRPNLKTVAATDTKGSRKFG